MDFETYLKIKRGNKAVITELINGYGKKAWFVSYCITENVCMGAPILINAFHNTFEDIMSRSEAPREDFTTLLYGYIYSEFLMNKLPDDDFQDLPVPEIKGSFRALGESLYKIPRDIRAEYTFYLLGKLTIKAIAEFSGLSHSEAENRIKKAEEIMLEARKNLGEREWAESVRLFTEFRNPTGSGFKTVIFPPFMVNALLHKMNLGSAAEVKRNGEDKMAASNKNVKNKKDTAAAARNKAKKIKLIVICSVAAVAVILGAIFLPRLIGNSSQPTSITTYNVEAVTSGDVDTTISGSGTLTPVSKDTIATTKAGTITTLNYEVGATVEEEAVIAILTDDNGSTTEFTAPYDGVLIELPISKDGEVAANSEIAMIMGTDGFTMGIAVDELDISTVKVGQEVSFTIDAVDGDYTGSVTAVSYNGTQSGGTTAYQITAKVDYIEGVYPGMSASAEIVIESSGEGLLVPTSAIRTSGDESYIYLAPSDAEEGTEYDEDEIDIDDLTKVTVETGMSDGSYTIVESDEIAEGDLIVIVTLTSTQTGSDSEGSGGFGGMGGFGGGRGEGGMNFGDFDFENFDPSQMPGGGGGFGGFGG